MGIRTLPNAGTSDTPTPANLIDHSRLFFPSILGGARMRFFRHRIGVSWLVGVSLLRLAASCHAADKLWDNANGGFFSEPLNWFGGMPGTNDVARFETTDSSFFQRTYTVDFTANISNQKMVVEDDGVTFNLKGHTYQLTDSFEAILLGTVPNRSGNL